MRKYLRSGKSFNYILTIVSVPIIYRNIWSVLLHSKFPFDASDLHSRFWKSMWCNTLCQVTIYVTFLLKKVSFPLHAKPRWQSGIKIQRTIELRAVWCWNNLKLEQKIRGKSGFETRIKTRKSNKESRGRHVVAFSLCLVARAVARLVLPWLIQWASRKFSLFLSLLFISLGYFYTIFNYTHSKWHQRRLLEMKSLRDKSYFLR
jgi:hypothetical protein